MAFVYVQTTKLEAGTGASFSGSVTSTAGNALFATAGYTGASTTPTISGGGTWTKDNSGANAALMAGSISSCPSATGGTQTITVSNVNGGVCPVHEFSGNPSSSIFDAGGTAATGTSASATTSSLSNGNANDVFIAMVVNDSTGSAVTMTGNTAGWTYPANGKETNANSFDGFGSGYNIVSTIASRSSNWTITSSDWLALIACYKAAGSAAAPVGKLVQVNQSIMTAVY